MASGDPKLFVTVDAEADEPAYEQIARQIRALVSSGALPPGTALPPVRTIASDLGYNLNTVARAYRLLEEEGFVQIRDRAGAVVARPAVSAPAGARDRLQRDLGEAIGRLRQAGVKPDAIRRMVERAIGSLGGAVQRDR